MSQIALPFDWPADAEKSDFIVSTCNETAVQHLDRWGSWPVRASLLVGPRKSGRSLLGRIFSANTGATVVDDAEYGSEQDIFHAWNESQENRQPLLLISERAPPEWAIRLPDLRSRLVATPVVEILPPDLKLCESLLAHLLARRGLAVAPDVAGFVAARMERTYVEIQRIVDLLDHGSLADKRAITIPFARKKLRAAGLLRA